MKLEELLAKAQENYEKLNTKNVTIESQLKLMSDELSSEKALSVTQKNQFNAAIDELKNEIADLEIKGNKPLLVLDTKSQDLQLKTAVRTAIGSFIRAKDESGKDTGRFKSFVVDHVKDALNLTDAGVGLESIDQVLSREVTERAREAYPIMGAVGMRNMPRSLREEILISYPSVQQGIENVAGTTISETEVQRYAEVVNQIAKINAKPRITDEAMTGSDLDLYGQLLRLLDDEVGRYVVNQILFGNGGSKNMRGILSSNRLDITNTTGKSFKPTIGADARDPDFYPAIGTGVSGGLPATDKAIVDWLIDFETALPTAYLAGAKWYMNRVTLGKFKKLRDANDNPVFTASYMGQPMSINGYPVVLDDHMPNFNVANAPFLIFGKLDSAFYISTGDIDYILLDPYSSDGSTIVKVNKEYFEIVGKNDAIIIGAATTASGG
jgi:HK97 family phage major capsid protein|tara:strand:- start:3954 stop:5270 length:1317 start_codon:yes stop_codon:yes gene_type:complete